MTASEANVTAQVLKFTARIIVYAFITSYFFRQDVLKYFRMENVSKIKALAYIVGVGLVLTLISSLWSWFGT